MRYHASMVSFPGSEQAGCGRSRTRSIVMMGLLLAGVSLGSGCQDPQVSIEFIVPSDYVPSLQSISLEVFTPPVADPFDCADVAFGRVDDKTLAASLVREIVVRGGATVDLSGIPRLGDKILIARGLDDQDIAVVAGCVALADIETDVFVPIVGFPIVSVDVPALAIGNPLPDRVAVLVRDVQGRPVSGVPVQWEVLGPGGQLLDGDGVTGGSGMIEISPQKPQLAGPAALDVRVLWQRSLAPSLRGFRAPEVVFSAPLPGDSTEPIALRTEFVYAIGEIGPNGEMGFAALGPTSDMAVGRQVFLAWFDATQNPPFRTVTTAPIVGALSLGVVTRDGRERVFTVTPLAWLEIDTNGALLPRASPRPGRVVDRIVSLGGCQPIDHSTVLLAFDDGTMGAFNGLAQPVDHPIVPLLSSNRFGSSGCVSSPSGVHRTVALSSGSGRHELVAMMDVARKGVVSAVGTTIGFAPPLGSEPGTLLTTEIAIEGTALVRRTLLVGPNATLDSEEVTRDDVATFVVSSAGGDFDGDGLGDVIGLLFFGDTDFASEVRLQVALGVPHREGRLTGVSELFSGRTPRVLAADFDGDGASELVIATREGLQVFRAAPGQ